MTTHSNKRTSKRNWYFGLQLPEDKVQAGHEYLRTHFIDSVETRKGDDIKASLVKFDIDFKDFGVHAGLHQFDVHASLEHKTAVNAISLPKVSTALGNGLGLSPSQFYLGYRLHGLAQPESKEPKAEPVPTPVPVPTGQPQSPQPAPVQPPVSTPKPEPLLQPQPQPPAPKRKPRAKPVAPPQPEVGKLEEEAPPPAKKERAKRLPKAVERVRRGNIPPEPPTPPPTPTPSASTAKKLVIYPFK